VDQEKLERDGIGFRCRGCGITVWRDSDAGPKLCTSCRQSREEGMHMTTRLQLAGHSLRRDKAIVEVWDGNDFIAAIYPDGARGIKVVSKYLMLVDTDARVAAAKATMIKFASRQ
jgi:hypothetical protein